MKEFVSKPLSSAYNFVELLDGRCGIQFKCKKQECARTVEETCPTTETCKNCETCKACPDLISCEKTIPPLQVTFSTQPPPKATKPPTPSLKITTSEPQTYFHTYILPADIKKPPIKETVNSECLSGNSLCSTRKTPSSTRGFRGGPYLPQRAIIPATTRKPWTGTYVINTGTLRQSNTWEPLRAGGTWIPRPTVRKKIKTRAHLKIAKSVL